MSGEFVESVREAVASKAAGVFDSHREEPAPSPFEAELAEAETVDTVETPAEVGDTVETPADAGSTVETPAEVGDTVETPAEESPFSDDLVTLGNAYGVDVTAFTDERNARAAIRLQAEYLARLGSQHASAPTAPEKPAEPVRGTETPEIDLSALEPQVAEVVRKVQAENENLRKQFETQEQQMREAEVQANRQQWESIAVQATQHLDTIASPELGVGDNVTLAQQMRRDAVFKLAGSLIQGLVATGRVAHAPDITKIMDTALELSGVTKPNAAAGTKPSVLGRAAAPTPAAPKLTQFSVQSEHDPMGLMQSKSFRKGIGEIFRKHRG